MSRSSHHIQLIQNAIDFIENRLQEDISVQTVTQTSGMSSWQFQRVFRSLVGDSIGNYLRRRRLTLAADRLVTTESRILDIAIDFQFGSQEAFSRAFKSVFRMTPNQFRKERPAVVLQSKPKITKEMLEHICYGVEREPEIRIFGPTKLMGTQTIIVSPLSRETDFAEKVPRHWADFNQRKKEIHARIGKKSYGLAMSSNKSMEEESMIYLSAVEVENFDDVPEGMVCAEIPETQYAAFQASGREETSQSTVNYIYGVWLPNSEYERGVGYDFEIFDQRYNLDDPDSVSEYWLPIHKEPS